MPTRTGLRTLYGLVRKMCQINAQWGAAILLVLPAQYHTYYAALSQACDDFVLNVPVKDILNDETP